MAKTRLIWWSRRFGYGFGSAFGGFAYTSISILYLFYLTNVIGLRPGLAGAVLALPKVWDAFVDPALGTWVDRQATRLGRRWPFLLAAGLTSLAAYVGMFSLPNLASSWATAAVALLLLIIGSMAQTIFQVCQLSITAEITIDSADLAGLFSLALTLFTIMTLLGSVLPPLLIGWFGGGRAGYSHMAAYGAAFSSILLLAFVGMTWRVPVRPISREASSLSLLASFRATAANRSFIYLLVYFIAATMGAAIFSAFTPYANLYILHRGPGGLAILGGISAAAAIVAYRLAPFLVRWRGIRQSMKLSNAALWSGYIFLFVASFGAIWSSWAAIGLIGIGSGISSVVLLAAMVDISRTPVKGTLVVPMGFYYALIVSGTKLGLSAGGLVVGIWLAAIGFVPGSSYQSSFTLSGLRAGYTLLLVVIFGAAGLLISRIRTGHIDSSAGVAVASTVSSSSGPLTLDALERVESDGGEGISDG